MNTGAAQAAFAMGYRVIAGNVVYIKTGRVRKMSKGSKNSPYPYLMARINGKPKTVRAHLLAAWQKFGRKCLSAEVVRHLDDDKTNFSLENIAIGSHSDSAYDRERNKAKQDASAEYAGKTEDLNFAFLGGEIGTLYPQTIKAILTAEEINENNHYFACTREQKYDTMDIASKERAQDDNDNKTTEHKMTNEQIKDQAIETATRRLYEAQTEAVKAFYEAKDYKMADEVVASIKSLTESLNSQRPIAPKIDTEKLLEDFDKEYLA